MRMWKMRMVALWLWACRWRRTIEKSLESRQLDSFFVVVIQFAEIIVAADCIVFVSCMRWWLKWICHINVTHSCHRVIINYLNGKALHILLTVFRRWRTFIICLFIKISIRFLYVRYQIQIILVVFLRMFCKFYCQQNSTTKMFLHCYKIFISKSNKYHTGFGFRILIIIPLGSIRDTIELNHSWGCFLYVCCRIAICGEISHD